MVATVFTFAFSVSTFPARAYSPDPVIIKPATPLIKPLPTLPPETAVALPEMAPIPVAAPTPPPAPRAAYTASGCVSGWSNGDVYLDKIIAYESGGNSCATNPGGCFGLLQACPGSPLRDACGGDPVCQIDWFQANKTGGRSWAEVWAHEQAYGYW